MFYTINKEARINPGFYYALRMHSFMYSVLFPTSSSLRRTSTSARKATIFRADFGRPAPFLLPPLLLFLSSIFLISNDISQFVYKYATSYKQAVSSLTQAHHLCYNVSVLLPIVLRISQIHHVEAMMAYQIVD